MQAVRQQLNDSTGNEVSRSLCQESKVVATRSRHERISSESSRVFVPHGLKRQPESTTEDLEDDEDQVCCRRCRHEAAMGAVCEETDLTIGIGGEKFNECEI